MSTSPDREDPADDALVGAEVLLARACEVDGVRGHRGRRKIGGEPRLKRCRQRRQLEPHVSGDVGGDHARPASVPDDSETPASRSAR